jgi:hypothetical protein
VKLNTTKTLTKELRKKLETKRKMIKLKNYYIWKKTELEIKLKISKTFTKELKKIKELVNIKYDNLNWMSK